MNQDAWEPGLGHQCTNRANDTPTRLAPILAMSVVRGNQFESDGFGGDRCFERPAHLACCFLIRSRFEKLQ
jgi:hypothetical protein